MPPAARVTDPVAHPLPPVLSPGPGSPTVLIGFLPAWRGVGGAAAAALKGAKQASDTTIQVAEAATMAASGTPAQPGLKAAEEATKAAAAAAMGGMISSMAGGADQHICGVPLPIPPHGPGVVINGSKAVLINNLPAARQGDSILEAVGPPNSIAMGFPQVLIGDGGGGGSGSGPSGSTSSAGSSLSGSGASAPSTHNPPAQAGAAAGGLSLAASSGTALVPIDAGKEGLAEASSNAEPKRKKQPATIRLRLFDPFKRPMPNTPYRVTMGSRVVKGKADGDAWVKIDADDTPDECVVEWGELEPQGAREVFDEADYLQTSIKVTRPGADGRTAAPAGASPEPEEPGAPGHDGELREYLYEQDVTFDVDGADDAALHRRLQNLGYVTGQSDADHVRAFQTVYEKPATGLAADLGDLRPSHDSCSPEPWPCDEPRILTE